MSFTTNRQRRLAVAGLVALAAARDVPRMQLADALGRTVCPLRAVVHDDPLRLPRRIKFLECEREPARRCPAAARCQRRSLRHGYATQCVEVFDDVVVQVLPAADAGAGAASRRVLQVPVGCACVVQTGTPAQEDY